MNIETIRALPSYNRLSTSIKDQMEAIWANDYSDLSIGAVTALQALLGGKDAYMDACFDEALDCAQ